MWARTVRTPTATRVLPIAVALLLPSSCTVGTRGGTSDAGDLPPVHTALATEPLCEYPIEYPIATPSATGHWCHGAEAMTLHIRTSGDVTLLEVDPARAGSQQCFAEVAASWHYLPAKRCDGTAVPYVLTVVSLCPEDPANCDAAKWGRPGSSGAVGVSDPASENAAAANAAPAASAAWR